MMLFDRYKGKTVSEKEIPNQIDFGRFCFTENLSDITYSNFPTNKAIKQDLLLDKNKSIQDILIDIAVDVEKSYQNEFSVVPLIGRIKNKLNLNEFEKLLMEKLFHLEEIFRVPNYLLHREIEKVHVSKAKRIPAKSYQYLASHTEDWVHKSIVSFKPSRILHEELELNFDIYENQLCVTLVQRCLVYLNSRLKEIQDIKSFLNEYEKLLKNRNDQKSWYKKTERNLRLIGAVYDDENYRGSSRDGTTLSETENILNQIQKRLQLFQKSDLFDLVNKRAMQSITLKNTNVLVNHKHYRYVKSIWIELNKENRPKTDSEKLKHEQDVINGLRQYAKSIIAYTLKDTLDYELKGTYQKFSGEHSFYDTVELTEDKNVFKIRIGRFEKRIIVIANESEKTKELIELLKKNNTSLFYYSENPVNETLQTISINPLDPDSIERVGVFIKKILLSSYSQEINHKFEFPHLLKEYVKYIPKSQVSFNTSDYTYSFHSYPKSDLKVDDIKQNIETDTLFAKKSRPDKDNVFKEFSNLIREINQRAEELKNKHLHCFNCGTMFQSYNKVELNYMKCPSCNALYDNSFDKEITLKIDDTRYNLLVNKEFGMDYISFNKEEL
jgi:predicted Zn-ribbon and HTH transcriptional regulator